MHKEVRSVLVVVERGHVLEELLQERRRFLNEDGQKKTRIRLQDTQNEIHVCFGSLEALILEYSYILVLHG